VKLNQCGFIKETNIKEIAMIARIWHGRTRVEDYETYTEFMKAKAIPDYRNTKGFVKLMFLRDIRENTGHFTLITFWERILLGKI
jgi:hypothetical protein